MNMDNKNDSAPNLNVNPYSTENASKKDEKNIKKQSEPQNL